MKTQLTLLALTTMLAAPAYATSTSTTTNVTADQIKVRNSNLISAGSRDDRQLRREDRWDRDDIRAQGVYDGRIGIAEETRPAR